MAKGSWAQNNAVVNAIVPVADTFASAANGDVMAADGCESIVFIVVTGAAADNTNVITVEACDNVTPDSSTAIAFTVQAVTTAGTYGAVTDVAATGQAFTASTANQYYVVEVDPADIEAASSHAGRNYVRCVVTEAGNAGAQVGCAIGIRTGLHFAQDVPASAIV
jgi:hypothetical protein